MPRVLMLVTGSHDDFKSFVADNPTDGLYLHQANWSVSGNYRISRTPSGVLIDQTGKIAAPTAVGWDDIQQLLVQGSSST
jgi:hypothetical protein